MGFLMLITVSISLVAQTATYRDKAAWNSVASSSDWTTFGYDVVLSKTNVTASQLGTTNGIPNLTDVLGKTRLLGVTNTVVAFNAFLAANPVPSPYKLWARTATYEIGTTNVIVSDWTNIAVAWVNLPLPPTGLRIEAVQP